MKGQAFTLDLFAAYAIFLIVLLMITMMAFWVTESIRTKEETDDMTWRAINTLDYLCYSEKYTDEPYLLKADAIDLFFAQGDSAIRQELTPGWNYTLKMIWMNGTEIHSSGEEKHDAGNIISYSRLAHYRGETIRIIMGVWEEREVN